LPLVPTTKHNYIFKFSTPTKHIFSSWHSYIIPFCFILKG
jgi:hypothetical protein